MERIHDINEINLEIDEIKPFANDVYSGFNIAWYSSIGFGEYTIYKERYSDEWHADSEHMDNNEDKEFIKKLMSLFIDKIIVH